MELDRRGPGGEVCGHVLTLGECIEQAVEGVGRMVLYGTRLIDLGLRALRPAELNAGRARDGNCCLDGRVPGALAAVALRDRHVDHVISAVVVGQQQQSSVSRYNGTRNTHETGLRSVSMDGPCIARAPSHRSFVSVGTDVTGVS